MINQSINFIAIFHQALREEPPSDWDMSEKWKYELSEAYIIIMALKVVFVVVFEVNDDINEQNVIKNILYFSML